MNITCLILEPGNHLLELGSNQKNFTIVISLNQLVRATCGKMGWDAVHTYNTLYKTIKDAYRGALDLNLNLPIISKMQESPFPDKRNYSDLFEYNQQELDRSYVRLTRRNHQT